MVLATVTETNSKKRKRPSGKSASRKKIVTSNSRSDKGDGSSERNTGFNEAFAHMDRQLLSDYIAQKTRFFDKELSAIELDDKYIPRKLVWPTNSIAGHCNYGIGHLTNLMFFRNRFSRLHDMDEAKNA